MLRLLLYVIKFWLHYLLLYQGNKVRYLRGLGARIGENCSIMNRIEDFSEPWLIELGNNVTLAGKVSLLTHDGASRVIRQNLVEANGKFGNKFGTIRIMDNCFIGVGAIILPNVIIGPNSIVGAGSVVTHNVPPDMVYAGNPAHFICTLEDYSKDYQENMVAIDSLDRESLRLELTNHFWHEDR